MIRSILIVGGGSAGYLAALTLKDRFPNLPITVLCSSELGIIQVGEGTTTTFGYHLHNFCHLDLKEFYRLAQPQWKIGIRFEWGPRPFFNYVFGTELDSRYTGLPRETGYYLDNTESFVATGVQSQLMNENKIWLRQPDGRPRIVADEFTYHLENEKLVGYFEAKAKERGIPIIDDIALEAQQDEHGVTVIRLKSGKRISADLYVDCSGFQSLLLGKTLQEPYCSYKDSLFCDRACVGGWDREDEPIKPYTTSTTMEAGWCWQIEHEQRINRGYVYSSDFISDADAEAEFRAKNPKIKSTRVVPFRSGRFERLWVKNVVGVGNASAFVEPLEATSLATICLQCQGIVDILSVTDLQPPPSAVALFNDLQIRTYDAIRDFLALHYRLNKRIDNEFWRACVNKTELHSAWRAVEYFAENGPSTLWRKILFEETDPREFGMEGCAPYKSAYRPSDSDRKIWATVRSRILKQTETAYPVPDAMALVRSDGWVWPDNIYDKPRSLRK
jgi:tryptophan halogenase